MIISKRAVILILASIIISNTVGMAIYSYLPPYLVSIGTDKSIIQLIISILPLTAFLFPPFIGRISDKFQNRFYFVISGTIGIVLTFFLLIFFRNLIFITIFLFLYGFSNSCYGMIAILFQEIVENDPHYITYLNSMVVVGWFIGAQFGGIFIEIYSVNNIFQFFFWISLINIFLILFLKENRDIIIERHNDKNIESLKEFERGVKRTPISGSIYIALFFRNFGLRPIISVLVLLMAFHLTSNTEIGFLIGVNPLIQIVLTLIIGRFINRNNLKIIMIIGYLLSTITILGYLISIDFFGFLIFQIIISFSYAMFWNASVIYIAQKTTPINKGKYIGYANSSFYLGSFIGGLFFSLLLTFNPNYYIVGIPMIVFPIVSVLSISLKFKLKD
ncbi:MAG: MFS transporter [Candidatus Hodarchaeota archaeon]